MQISRRLLTLFGALERRALSRAGSCKPRLEKLEDRNTPGTAWSVDPGLELLLYSIRSGNEGPSLSDELEPLLLVEAESPLNVTPASKVRESPAVGLPYGLGVDITGQLNSAAPTENRAVTAPWFQPAHLESQVDFSAWWFPAAARPANEVRHTDSDGAAIQLGEPVDDGTGQIGQGGITAFQGSGMQASSDLWWFGGTATSGYMTQISLWMTNYTTYAGTYVWTITSGAEIVDFHNGQDTFTGTNINQVGLLSAAGSNSWMDVAIQCVATGTQGGVATATAALAVARPDHFVHLNNDDKAGPGGGGWDSFIHYRIEDQFNRVLPGRVPINEKFTTVDITDLAGENWPQSQQGGAVVNPVDFFDRMGAHIVAGQNPVPLNPQNPLSGTKVDHWTQEWYVGSTAVGLGVKVKTNTFQRYLDHGRHE